MYRHFSVSNKLGKGSLSKQSKFLNKLLYKDVKKGHLEDPFALPLMMPGHASKIRPHQTQKRIAVLTKVLTSYITDLIFNGDVGPELLETEIEIHDIEVAANVNVIRIYWSHKDMNDENIGAELEEMVVKAGLELRNKLSQLNVIGMVPPVVFIKYKYSWLEQEVNERLRTADYGPDHNEQTYKDAATRTVTYQPAGEGEKADVECANNEFSATFPVMTHNVMGVSHSKIMSKIKLAMEKSHKATKDKDVLVQLRNDINAMQPAKYSKILEKQQKQQEDFTEYINKVKKEQKIKRKPSRLKHYEQYADTEEYTGFADVYDDNDTLEEEEIYFDDDFEKK